VQIPRFPPFQQTATYVNRRTSTPRATNCYTTTCAASPSRPLDVTPRCASATAPVQQPLAHAQLDRLATLPPRHSSLIPHPSSFPLTPLLDPPPIGDTRHVSPNGDSVRPDRSLIGGTVDWKSNDTGEEPAETHNGAERYAEARFRQPTNRDKFGRALLPCGGAVAIPHPETYLPPLAEGVIIWDTRCFAPGTPSAYLK